MCCFSGPVESVSNTSIFARVTSDGRQLLAYGMSYAAPAELAMVLPLPVPPGSGEGAVRFINLEKYPGFFADMYLLFEPERRSGMLGVEGLSVAGARLRVHDVGSFEASFVPARADFSRLDGRFRLPAQAWERLPQYADYGFAVFKLKPAASKRGVHPMALSFPTRNAQSIFMPTVHIHDGEVHDTARFDHTLYFQARERPKGFSTVVNQPRLTLIWTERQRELREYFWVDRCEGLVDPEAKFFFRLRFAGEFENCDTWIGEGAHVPEHA